VSAKATELNDTPPASRWRLWIDGCGGYLLLSGSRWTLGGVSETSHADICVRADLPRLAGTIERCGGDYFWKPVQSHSKRELAKRELAKRELVVHGRSLSVSGSAGVILQQPSALCDSAVLTVRPPHRLDEHVDAVVLANQTVLVGPGSECHIRCRELVERVVLIRRDDSWMVKEGTVGQARELRVGERVRLQTLAMTLEQA
jgi:hypothetical protein